MGLEKLYFEMNPNGEKGKPRLEVPLNNTAEENTVLAEYILGQCLKLMKSHIAQYEATAVSE